MGHKENNPVQELYSVLVAINQSYFVFLENGRCPPKEGLQYVKSQMEELCANASGLEKIVRMYTSLADVVDSFLAVEDRDLSGQMAVPELPGQADIEHLLLSLDGKSRDAALYAIQSLLVTHIRNGVKNAPDSKGFMDVVVSYGKLANAWQGHLMASMVRNGEKKSPSQLIAPLARLTANLAVYEPGVLIHQTSMVHFVKGIRQFMDTVDYVIKEGYF